MSFIAGLIVLLVMAEGLVWEALNVTEQILRGEK